jgi:SpoVK/Ycf46/Vps4 family AAA+-type ATPase
MGTARLRGMMPLHFVARKQKGAVASKGLKARPQMGRLCGGLNEHVDAHALPQIEPRVGATLLSQCHTTVGRSVFSENCEYSYGILLSQAPALQVIMTTNHPEKLDPALVRPGRINKKMLLGYLHLPEAVKMVEHYFGMMTDRQRDKMNQLFTPNVFTPAQVTCP